MPALRVSHKARGDWLWIDRVVHSFHVRGVSTAYIALSETTKQTLTENSSYNVPNDPRGHSQNEKIFLIFLIGQRRVGKDGSLQIQEPKVFVSQKDHGGLKSSFTICAINVAPTAGWALEPRFLILTDRY